MEFPVLSLHITLPIKTIFVSSFGQPEGSSNSKSAVAVKPKLALLKEIFTFIYMYMPHEFRCPQKLEVEVRFPGVELEVVWPAMLVLEQVLRRSSKSSRLQSPTSLRLNTEVRGCQNV